MTFIVRCSQQCSLGVWNRGRAHVRWLVGFIQLQGGRYECNLDIRKAHQPEFAVLPKLRSSKLWEAHY